MVNIGQELMSSATPLFIQSGTELEGLCWVPNPDCHDVPKLTFCGQLMGACIRSVENLVVDLPPFIWKKIAGSPVTVEDFEVVAPTQVQSIRQVQEMDCSPDDFESLCLTFSFTMLGGEDVELVPDGDARAVTLENRTEFCQLALQACMDQFDEQIALIRNGLNDYKIPTVALMLWTPDEFQERVAGLLEISIEALQRAITLHGSGQQQGFFWECCERLSMEQRGMLLKFASGRNRLPVHITISLGEHHRKSE